MSDQWLDRELCYMRNPLEERKIAEERLLYDPNTHEVEGKGYSWKQTPEEIEILLGARLLDPVEAKSTKVVIKPSHLSVTHKGESLFEDDLWEQVRPDESTWTVEGQCLVIQLQKVPLEPPERNNWPRCGRSEPHKYEKEHLAKLARREERRRLREEAAALAEAEMEEHSDSEKQDGYPAAPELQRPGQDLALDPAMPRRRAAATATTGTQAERERLRRERENREDSQWKQGTKEESWAKMPASRSLGPLPAAEAKRRNLI